VKVEPKVENPKVEERKKEIQSDIDKLISDKKALEAEVAPLKDSKNKIAELEKQIQELTAVVKKPQQDSDIKSKVTKANQDLINKDLVEDKVLPREQRRE